MNGSCFLKTLGFPALQRPDGRPLKLKVRKHLALLIYLAVNNREFHRREELVELFWDDVPEERGRHSLSVALSVLRSALGDDTIEATANNVHLREGAVLLDLDLLHRGEVLGSPVLPALEVDRFLEGFEIESLGFQHWRDSQQAQLLPSIQAGLLILADHARRSGDTPGVLVLAERLLAVDPLSEEGIRAKVQALAMRGDRVSALRAYEAWKEELSRQLGALPSELLEGIATRLRRRAIERPDTSATPSVQTDHWADRAFVGRAAEFRELSDAWDSVTELNARHVLITGESGIGKSTLAMRFGTSVALEGAAVARVQCFELEQRIAFGMIGSLVNSLLDRPGAVATAPESLAEIARIVPKVRERFPHLPRPRPTEGEAARLHFAEGTFALFDAIMDEQALVLIIDDYPRSDEASLAILHMLLRRVGADRLMVIMTARPPEPDEPAQATRLRNGISYLPMRHVELSPLSDLEGEAMLESVLGSNGKGPEPPLKRAILMASSGNPMALDLLAQDWAAHGDAAIAISLPAMRSDMPASAMAVAGYDRLIDRMVPDLGPATRAALYLAAILGPRLNDLDYFGIVDLTPAQSMMALSELVSRRVLRDTGGKMEFTNELVRARLYLKVPSAARTRMHSGVASRLLDAVAAGDSISGLEIAWHCIRAKRRDEATPFLMAGARDAIVHGAPDEATRALSTALGHLTGVAKDEALLLLAEAYQEMGASKAALECIEELSDNQRANSHLCEMSTIMRLDLRNQLGLLSTEEVIAACEDCVSKATTYKHKSSRVHASLVAASTAADLHLPALTESVATMLSQFSATDLDQRSRGKLLLARGMTQYLRRAGEKGHEDALAGEHLLEEAGAADTTFVRLQIGLGAIACTNGRYVDAMPHFEAAFHAAARLDNEPLMSTAACNLSLCHHRTGTPEEQLIWATRSNECVIETLRGASDDVFSQAQRALAFIALGRGNDAVRTLEELRQAIALAVVPWVWQLGSMLEADVLWLLGRKRNAFDAITRMRQIADAALTIGSVGSFVRWSTLLLISEGRIEEARGLLVSTLGRMEELDLFDQAETLCCLELLRHHTEINITTDRFELRTVLAKLPDTCCRQLADLGLLLPDRRSQAFPEALLRA